MGSNGSTELLRQRVVSSEMLVHNGVEGRYGGRSISRGSGASTSTSSSRDLLLDLLEAIGNLLEAL